MQNNVSAILDWKEKLKGCWVFQILFTQRVWEAQSLMVFKAGNDRFLDHEDKA